MAHSATAMDSGPRIILIPGARRLGITYPGPKPDRWTLPSHLEPGDTFNLAVGDYELVVAYKSRDLPPVESGADEDAEDDGELITSLAAWHERHGHDGTAKFLRSLTSKDGARLP